MIITQTPFRMSFFGGGTDFPGFYKEHGGAVISTTFDKYCYVNVRHLPRFFDYSTELSYSRIERVTDVEAIEHPAIREAMKYLDMQEIRLTYEADLPARSGLGTSSSFAVGMLNAFYALKGKYADKRKLADDAIYLERVLCKESGGVQDQIAASFGFQPASTTAREQLTVPPMASASSSRILKFSGLPTPRPPETRIFASMISATLETALTTSMISTYFSLGTNPGLNSSISAFLPASRGSFCITPGRTVAICGRNSGQAIVAIVLPPNAGRVIRS